MKHANQVRKCASDGGARMPSLDWSDGALTTLRAAQAVAFGAHVLDLAAALTRPFPSDAFSESREELNALCRDFARIEDPLVADLAECRAIEDLLKILLRSAQQACSITKVRHYHYEEYGDDAKLVSVESVGHDPDVAVRLRIGHIVKFRKSSPLPEADSFWCFELGVPTVFRLDETWTGPLKLDWPRGNLPIITTHEQCGDVLAGHKSGMWVDMPLSVAGKYVAKLTCDLVLPNSELDESIVKPLMHLWCQAQKASPFLNFLYHDQLSHPLHDVLLNIHKCQGTEELFTYCTEKLPGTVFGCRHASIFTVLRDSLGSEKLLLRKTSYGPSRSYENSEAYRLYDDGLTPWVARTGRSLRLHDLLMTEELNRQLKAYAIYDKKLRWTNTIQDSKDHTSFLAVAIPASENKVLSVIRFTQKIDGGRFTERDQVLLETIAARAIAPKLLALRDVEFARRVSFNNLQEANAINLDEAASPAEVADRFRRALGHFFPEKEGARKLYLFNILEEDAQSFRHHVVSGRLKEQIDENKVYSIEGTLTGRALEEPRGVVFLDDLQYAEEQKAVEIICPEAKCALACRVAFNDKRYGVIVIESDRYDLFPETDGRLLEVLAAEGGAMFARRELLSLLVMYKLISKRRGSYLPQEVSLEARELPNHLSKNIDAYRRRRPADAARIPATPVNVRDMINRAARAAQVESHGKCRMRCDLPDETVRAHAPIIATIIYNLLRYQCEHASVSGEDITVRASVTNGWLELSVESNQAGTSESAATAVSRFGLFASLPTWETQPQGRDSRLSLSRGLAYWHQLTGGRRGVFSVRPAPAKGKKCFVLRLPVDPQSDN